MYCDRLVMGAHCIGGERYVCGRSATDTCQTIRQEKAEFKRQTDFMVAQGLIQRDGGTQVKCGCGHSFFTEFPLTPPSGMCPHCGAVHVQNLIQPS